MGELRRKCSIKVGIWVRADNHIEQFALTGVFVLLLMPPNRSLLPYDCCRWVIICFFARVDGRKISRQGSSVLQ